MSDDVKPQLVGSTGGWSDRLWLVLFSLLPILFNPFSRWQHEPDRVALSILLAGLLAGLSPTIPTMRGRVTWFLVGHMATQVLASALSIAPHWSLLGDPAWENGLVATLAGGLLFLLARTHLGDQKRAMHALLGGSALVALYGVLQYLELDPFAPGGPIVRVFSTLAHPNLLAAYLAITVPLAAAGLLAGRERWRHKVGLAALLGLQVACLILTFSRAGWLGALTGCSIVVMGWLWSKGKRRLTLVALIGSIAGLIGLMLLSLLPPLPNAAPHVLHTLTSLFRSGGATSQIRLLAWKATLEAIAQRPWLGYGPGTYRALLEWFQPPELTPFGGAGALGGRPHNVLLEVAVESGLIGLVAYLALIAALLVPLVRAVIRDDDRPKGMTIGILGGLVADLVVNLFSFENAVTRVFFWSLAGMAHASLPGHAPGSRPHPAASRIGLAMAGLVAAVAIVLPGVLAASGDALAAQGAWLSAGERFEAAASVSTTPEVFVSLAARAYQAHARQTGSDEDWQRGLDLHRYLIKRQPFRVQFWGEMGAYMGSWHASMGDASRAAQAIEAYQEAVALAPGDVDLRLDLALAHLAGEDRAEALTVLEDAASLLDAYPRTLTILSQYHQQAGDARAAEKSLKGAATAQQAWDDWVWRR